MLGKFYCLRPSPPLCTLEVAPVCAPLLCRFVTAPTKAQYCTMCFQGFVTVCLSDFQGNRYWGTVKVNKLILSILLQEREGSNSFNHETPGGLNNQFELVFVVGFQKILKLMYVDKLIDGVHWLFRDKYQPEIQHNSLSLLNGTRFHRDFMCVLREAEESSTSAPTAMKKSEDYEKAKKPLRFKTEIWGRSPRGKLKSETPKKKDKKVPWMWVLGCCPNEVFLFYSPSITNGTPETTLQEDINHYEELKWGWGQLGDLDCSSSDNEGVTQSAAKPALQKKTRVGWMGAHLKGLVGSESLSCEDLESVLDKMRDHLIAKNVSVAVAFQLLSVANMVERKIVKQALYRSLIHILQLQRCVDMLDIMDIQYSYTDTFCGFNGVGKSTNLAKMLWQLENSFSFLITACDTFAGMMKQLSTQRGVSVLLLLKNLGDILIHIFENVFAGVRWGERDEGISFAWNQGFDVVLGDITGIQDNASLNLVIAIKTPSLVLLVEKALGGNEAVDLLVKFSKALINHIVQTFWLIDGIFHTRFYTIIVGAAISKSYITNKPIVFLGTGQTYNDLRKFNDAVVAALMKA
ncbi:LOW QUALITY PROTEIN: signal recognition particle receptor subunit alpha [Sarcophilus harrisii]